MGRPQSNMEDRIDLLEREILRWKRVLATTALLGVTIFCGGWRANLQTPDRIYANRGFVVRDKSGMQRLYAGIRDDGSVGVDLMDARGKIRAYSNVPAKGNDDVGFGVRDEKGRLRQFVGRKSDLYSILTMGEGGKPLTRLGQGPQETWGVSIFDKDGKERVDLGGDASPDQAVGFGLNVRDAQGTRVLSMVGTSQGEPRVRMRDRRGVDRVLIGVDRSDKASFRMRGSDDSDRLIMDVNADDSVEFQVRDGDQPPLKVGGRPSPTPR